jgi:hypothetical protein
MTDPALNSYDYLTLSAAQLAVETGTPWSERSVVQHAAATRTEDQLDRSVAHLAAEGLVTLTPDGPVPTPDGTAYYDRVSRLTPPPIREFSHARYTEGLSWNEATDRYEAAKGHAETRATEAAARAFPDAAEAVDRPQLGMPKPRPAKPVAPGKVLKRGPR